MSATLIIAPHSMCGENPMRHCDRVAKNISERLYNSIGTEYKRIISAADYGIFRFGYGGDPHTDLNRRPSRTNKAGKQFRDDIINQLRAWEDDQNVNYIYVYEVHSYPRDGFNGHEPMYLLTHSNQDPTSFVEHLSKLINHQVNYYIKDELTDIQQHINDQQFNKIVHSFLIEFCENLNSHDPPDAIPPADKPLTDGLKNNVINALTAIAFGAQKKGGARDHMISMRSILMALIIAVLLILLADFILVCYFNVKVSTRGLERIPKPSACPGRLWRT